MKVWFARGKEGEANVLTCFRDDGSAVWTPLGAFFPYHDLTHYAVETTLGCRDAFFGLIAQGWDIRDFIEKERDPVTGGSVKSVLPDEALGVENIVGTMDRLRALPEGLDAPNAGALFFEMMAATRQTQRGVPEITSEQFQAIRDRCRDLIGRWRALAPGERLELEF